ncbi:MAG: primosomal protein N' [Candidatus Saccharimonadales bacterium]
MLYYEVAPTRIARAGSDSFTYASDSAYAIGQIVRIEVGKKQEVGVIIATTTKPSYATKPILGPVEDTPLPDALVTTARWMSTYYATPLATVLQTILPRGLQKNRRTHISTPHTSRRNRAQFLLNTDQREAIETIMASSTGTSLLHGITGSGKTHVYIETAQQTLARGQSVIILVPEIALTSQLVDEFSHYFDDIILTHSKQTEAERHRAWREALTSTAPRVIIGPRSAVFMPLPQVGLIVIDEAHEPSFKQEQSPRYSALRVASVLAQHHTPTSHVVLGSATPTVSDYYLASQHHRPIITLSKRARPNAIAPIVTVVDLTKRHTSTRHRFLSDPLLRQIDTTLAQNKQILVFHNRRGSASTTLCEQCGWVATCTRCFVPMTLHADRYSLECHICGHQERMVTSCPDCQYTNIIHKGIGTKLIESELRKLYPDKTIIRFDADTTHGNTVEQRYSELYDGTIDIIIGTQVIAKGLDLPHLRTVGIVQADAGLSLPDYGAAERTFQLIAQVVGRVGRSHHDTQVVLQSYHPSHPAIIDGISQDFHHFYTTTLAERKRAQFPPFVFLMQLTCVYKTEAAAIRNSRALAQTLKQHAPTHTTILGPTPAFYERQHDTYRWQLIVKSPKRADLIALTAHIPPAHWHVELDPVSLL